MKGNVASISCFLALMALGSSVTAVVQSSQSNSSSPSVTSVRDYDLENKVKKLETELQQQKLSLDGSRQLMSLLLGSESFGKCLYAELDPTSKNYGKVDTNAGVLLISCQDAQPFLDGYKIKLHIGNPMGATFVGFKLTARWGSRYTGPTADYVAKANWNKTFQSKDFSFPQSLEAGRWNAVELNLAPATPSEVGCIQIFADTNVVSLGAVR